MDLGAYREMYSVGEKLRRERLHRRLDLAQISSELKISARMLEAIEEEKFERLPGGVFTKSFVRQYARLLGLDEHELAAEAQRLIESPFAIETLLNAEPKAGRTPLIQVPRVESWDSLREKRFSWFSWMPAAALVIVVILVCSQIYDRWQRSHQPAPQMTRGEQPLGVREEPRESLPQSVPVAGTPADPAAPGADTSAPAAAAGEAAPVPSNSNVAVRVELTAREQVWISARADGKILFSGMLTENETRTVEATDRLLLRVGNAGVINVKLNGKSLGALGANGQPRTVQFTSGGFQTVAASRPVLPL